MSEPSARPGPSRGVRAPATRRRPDRAANGGSTVLVNTPLVASRSLGALLGFESLAFKLEACQPTGSWLDRDAARLVHTAVQDGLTGLCVVDAPALTVPLAAQCARAGLRLVVLRSVRDDLDATGSTDRPATPSTADGWLAALGSRQIVVQASPEALAAAGEHIAARAGLRLVIGGPPQDAALEGVAGEIEASGQGRSVLAVPVLAGNESAILERLAARRTAAVPLPLDDLAGSSSGQTTSPFAVVGRLDSSGGEATPSDSVLSVSLSAREAEAARVLLSREEGLIVSPAGAAALAALVRAVRADRAQRPRERRFPRDLAAVVVLTGDPLGMSGSPPPAADAIPVRAVTLAELMANPQRLLVEPPGNGG